MWHFNFIFSNPIAVSGLQNWKIQVKSKTSLQFSRWERFSVFRVLINSLKSSQIISYHLKSSQNNNLHHLNVSYQLEWTFNMTTTNHNTKILWTSPWVYINFTFIWTQLSRSTFHKIVNESEATLKKKSKSSREDRRRISLFKKPICNMLVVTKGC